MLLEGRLGGAPAIVEFQNVGDHLGGGLAVASRGAPRQPGDESVPVLANLFDVVHGNLSGRAGNGTPATAGKVGNF